MKGKKEEGTEEERQVCFRRERGGKELGSFDDIESTSVEFNPVMLHRVKKKQCDLLQDF